jgi:hypothetical protein
MSKPKTAAERQRARSDRMKKAGFVPMKIWVPPDKRQDVRDLEAQLQWQHEQQDKKRGH